MTQGGRWPRTPARVASSTKNHALVEKCQDKGKQFRLLGGKPGEGELTAAQGPFVKFVTYIPLVPSPG